MVVDKKERRIVAIVWVIGIILVWSFFAFALQNIFHDKMASTKLPYPHSVFMTIIKNWKMLLEASAVTFSRATIGFVVGAGVGIVLAVVMSLSKTIERIAFPYLIISQMIPVLGLAPIIFNIVRDMNTSRIVIAAYITFFPVSVNMLSGLKSVEQEKKDLLYSIAANKLNVYYKLMFPFSMSYLFTGLKIAAPMAVTASILVDMLGSSSGIGVKILYSLYSSSNGIFWASVITSAFMGVISFYIVVFAERIFLPWQKDIVKKEGEAA
ncbi:putative aliphatic sulfonates transport permease protein SsuC [Clostridium homopropionicum DSM 5847]|uniref:Putative aliphatic sulfonates transport permease protein SsuC n=1 Tax=Clostridium homopropionicum DSM 5847 TaxID=1121318 RepID=A0A0L6ZAV2_9CLOT|nr:ABC transporter permease [Clostridium homopropionicum]KOA20095.1 putative aliphatic sulfonates transport permease protein SsuC [Clostridium homopropionicum DSM 5847]SFG86558.1 NitT/TauT family transport system permease protein [Clostridium homopropionicum]